jgi:hypothetical protein
MPSVIPLVTVAMVSKIEVMSMTLRQPRKASKGVNEGGTPMSPKD